MPLRQAARLVILDSRGSILLVKYADGRAGRPAYYWSTPGGGVESGETHFEAAHRELREETGLLATVGRELWSQRVRLDLPSGRVEQLERYFLVRLADVEPEVHNTSPEDIVAHRWWPMSDLRTTKDRVFPEQQVKRGRVRLLP